MHQYQLNTLLFFTYFLIVAPTISIFNPSNPNTPHSGTASLWFSLLGLSPDGNCGWGNLPIFCCFSDLSRSSLITNLPHPVAQSGEGGERLSSLQLIKGNKANTVQTSARVHDCVQMCLHHGCRSTIRL